MNTAKLKRANLLNVTLVLLVAALFSAIGLLVAVPSTDAQAQTSTATGQVWAWGDNSSGQLGDGTTTNRLTPVEVSGLSDVQAIAAGNRHSLALRNDSGIPWAWGNNFLGQLGDGGQFDRFTPVQVSSLSGVQAIAAGAFHSLALRDGLVWAWGFNEINIVHNPPVQVDNLSGVQAIAGGEKHSLALKNDGTVWAWGFRPNLLGQRGDGSATPVQVSGLSDVQAIAAGDRHSLVLKNDGTVWALGENEAGQLGDGTTTTGPTPVQVSGLSDVQAIAAGGSHSLAVSVAPAQDSMPPTLILPADITEEALDATGTTVDYTATATDDVDGSLPANSINCSPASGSLFPIGTTEVNCSATDAAGNTASDSFNVLVRDTTAPVIAPHDDVSATATSSNGANVSYTSPETTDAVDGPGTANCTPGSGSQFALGSTTVTCSATDAAGNQASGSFEVTVVYPLGEGTGEYVNHASPPTVNTVGGGKAGAGIPVRFSLGGNFGLDIFAAGYPTSKNLDCNTGESTEPVDETLAVSNSGLKYDADADEYTYTWKTNKKWAGTCRQLIIRLKDGTEHPLNFHFSK
jgi:hypothetical protein